MRAVSIVGPKKVGKTTWGLSLVEELQRRGVRVAAAKHTRHHFDRPESDTAKYLGACEAVVSASPEASAVSWAGELPLTRLAGLAEAEFLVAEGFRETQVLPRVLLLEEASQAEAYGAGLAVATAGDVGAGGLPHAGSVAELADIVLEQGFLLPGLDCGHCEPGSCAGLAREIAAGRLGEEACRTRRATVSVTVNGRSLDLNPFVAGILHGGISGMLASLKGFAPGSVEIRLEV